MESHESLTPPRQQAGFTLGQNTIVATKVGMCCMQRIWLTSVTEKVEFSATCQVRQGSFRCLEHINILFHCHEDGLSRRMVHMKPDLHLEHER